MSEPLEKMASWPNWDGSTLTVPDNSSNQRSDIFDQTSHQDRASKTVSTKDVQCRSKSKELHVNPESCDEIPAGNYSMVPPIVAVNADMGSHNQTVVAAAAMIHDQGVSRTATRIACGDQRVVDYDVGYGRIVFMAVATILILFMFLLAQFSLRALSGKGCMDHAKEHFHRWFQKAVFKHNWEDIHCQPKQANESIVEESWIPELAKQLNLKDGTSVFDSNTGCNKWLKLLTKKYHNLRIGGAHDDQYAVEYAKRLFNDTPSTFGTISSDGKLDFFDDHIEGFAHVINYGGLRNMPNRRSQCNLVRELLRILQPGGSMYLGHNMEETDCKVVEKFASVSLPGCYWSEECLKNRTDIDEIYYIKEKDLFGAHSQIHDCYTAVFIHKKIAISRTLDAPETKKRYKPHEKMYYCKKDNQDEVGIAKKPLQLGQHFVPHSLGQAYNLAKKMHEKITNVSQS